MDSEFTIPGLVIESVLGEGSNGRVYLAQHQILQKKVAVKVLLAAKGSDESARLRFQREAQFLSKLEHPNIVKVYAFGWTAEAVPYIVMDYIEGKNLETLVQENGALSVHQSCDIIEKIAEALQSAHLLGITHRDIKPSNIILANGDCPMLLDFGVAKFADGNAEQGITKTSQIVGTPAFLSPEQAAGKPATPQSDMYALSCVLFFLLTGRTLFTGQSDLEVMLKHANESPDVSSLALGDDIKLLLAKALAKKPEERFENMQQLIAQLRNADREIKPTKRPAKPIFIPVIAVIAFSSIFAFVFWKNKQAKSHSTASIIFEESEKKDLAKYKLALQNLKDSNGDGSKRNLRAFLGTKLSNQDPMLRLKALDLFAQILLREGKVEESLSAADKMMTTVKSDHYAASSFTDSERYSGFCSAYKRMVQALLLKEDQAKALSTLDEFKKLAARYPSFPQFDFDVHALECEYFEQSGKTEKMHEAASKCYSLSSDSRISFDELLPFFQEQLLRELKNPNPTNDLLEWKKSSLACLERVLKDKVFADKAVDSLIDFCRDLYKHKQQNEELDLLYKSIPVVLDSKYLSTIKTHDYVAFFLGESKHFSSESLDPQKIQTIHKYIPAVLKLPLEDRDLRNLFVFESYCTSVLLIISRKEEAVSHLITIERALPELRKTDSPFRELYLQCLASAWAYPIDPRISDAELEKIREQAEETLAAMAKQNRLDKKSVDCICAIVRLLAGKKHYAESLKLIEEMSPFINRSTEVPAADKLVLFNAKVWIIGADKTNGLSRSKCEAIESESCDILEMAISERNAEKANSTRSGDEKDEAARFTNELNTCISSVGRLLESGIDKRRSDAFQIKARLLSKKIK